MYSVDERSPGEILYPEKRESLDSDSNDEECTPLATRRGSDGSGGTRSSQKIRVEGVEVYLDVEMPTRNDVCWSDNGRFIPTPVVARPRRNSVVWAQETASSLGLGFAPL